MNVNIYLSRKVLFLILFLLISIVILDVLNLHLLSQNIFGRDNQAIYLLIISTIILNMRFELMTSELHQSKYYRIKRK